jgi:hypothetical protein
MIKIEIPENASLALHFGKALMDWANEQQGHASDEELPQTLEQQLEELPQTPAYATDQPVQPYDENGVSYDPEFCAPDFVKSGKRKGEWKIKDGVNRTDFKEWYNQSFSVHQEKEIEDEPKPKTVAKPKPKPKPKPEPKPEPQVVDAASVFGQGSPQTPAPAAITPEQVMATMQQPAQQPGPDLPEIITTAKGSQHQLPESVVRVQKAGPRDIGELMAWISEYQGEKYLTSDQIAASYAEAGLTVRDLFPPTPDPEIAQNLAKVFSVLKRYAHEALSAR